ncbi:hypothetical protein BN14_08164 [Rhizoctonia solani AG-1 IB]|uniref:Uncharacterized protein n=1 Tax=Thanatephorus cucumeris (strain AG1-IB / isolate 7/3/14) TaxID=1108050 RepID=M5CDY5_THACB|nr:hypothetical protein BN14_08164 [Rhizoctonia solani AG-1 IB]
MPVVYFEGWRVGDAIPVADIPRGGQHTKHRKTQAKSAGALLERCFRVHAMWVSSLDEDDPNFQPQIEDCMPSPNPRDYYSTEVKQGETFLAQVGESFTEMNINLTPSFHAMAHLGDHIWKYGNVFAMLQRCIPARALFIQVQIGT